jgi:ribosomal protein L10
MSKLVKRLVSRDISSRLDGVKDAILVNVIGMESGATYNIRKALRDKGIGMLVVKRSLAYRATESTTLQPAFANVAGSIAVVWGCEDFVSLAKEITTFEKRGGFAKFEIKGGVMDGEALDADKVRAISKWPSRTEQIAMLLGQILSPGSNLVGQILGPSRTIAGQVKKHIENLEGTPAE